jgi:hypothetical protein
MRESTEGEESSVFAGQTLFMVANLPVAALVQLEFSVADEIGGGQYGKNGSWFV